jgi:hypothetical protein
MFLIKKSFLFLLFGAIYLSIIPYQDPKIPAELIRSFETGNSKVLAQHFNQNIEMSILGIQNFYSKAQAQQIIAKFFNANLPESFTVLSKVEEKDAINVIGLLKTKNENFRVYLLLKESDKKKFIHLLKIEKR